MAGMMVALWLVFKGQFTIDSPSPFSPPRFVTFITVADAEAYLRAHGNDPPGAGTTLPRLSLPRHLPSAYALHSISIAPGLTTFAHLVYATASDGQALTLEECSLCGEADSGRAVRVGAFTGHLVLHPGFIFLRPPVAELSWMAGAETGFRLVLHGDVTGQQVLATARSLT